MDDRRNAPPVLPWVLVAVLGMMVLVLGACVLILLGRLRQSPAAPATARPTAPTPARVVPKPAMTTLGKGIQQREDGWIFIHAGRGSMNVKPSGPDPYAFGLRPPPPPVPPEIPLSHALVNADAPRRFNLTAEQQAQLAAVGPMPRPTPAAEEQMIALFEAFAASTDAGRPAAEQALLDAVRQEGDARAGAVDRWHADRAAVLTPQQRALMLPAGRSPATLPAVER